MPRNLTKILAGFLLLLLALFMSAKAASAAPQELQFHYFYINLCESCREADDTIQYYKELLQDSDEGYDFRFFSYNIAGQDSLELMQAYCAAYKVPPDLQEAPLLFIGDLYFTGPEEIQRGLQDLQENLEAAAAPPRFAGTASADGAAGIVERFNNFKFFNVAAAGFVNGLNPCSLSMLLFLLSLLLARKDIHIAVISGSFLAGKFAAYLLLGTVLYRFFSAIDMQAYQIVLKTALGIFLAILVFLNILDYFNARNEQYGRIKNQLPPRLRKLNHAMISRFNKITDLRALTAAAALLGIIISVGEFLCTGQVYLATIIYLLQSDAVLSFKAFSYLFLYSLFFIIPPALVILFIARTRKLMGMSEAVRKRMPLIKLLTTAVLLIAGVLVILN